jgi:hypothetical protein
MKHSVIFIFFTYFLLGCSKDSTNGKTCPDKEVFNAEEQSWFTYKTTRTLIYQNKSNQFDTFFFMDYKVINIELLDGLAWGQDTCYKPVKGYYTFKNTNNSIVQKFEATKDKTNYWGINMHPTIGDLSTNMRLLKPVAKKTINNRDYLDVYELERDVFPANGFQIKSMKFNKEFGFIQYEDKNNDIWTLIKIL